MHQNRPDILVILCDDMGYSDLGCYGGEVATPHLDALAAGGLRFTRFANTPRCSPSRASLLTGLYPHQCGIGVLTGRFGEGDYEGDLNRRCVTMPEVLGASGYRCTMSGKWHLTDHDCFDAPNGSWPTERGFDHFYGTLGGVDSFFWPMHFFRDLEPVTVSAEEDFYYTDAISDDTVRRIEQHAENDPDSPFFHYTAFTAPHFPLHAREEDIATYRGRFDRGWDVLREERRQRMVELGLIGEDWPLTTRDPAVPAWDDVPDDRKVWECRRMEVYAAMIEAMDRGIGRIVDALKKTGRLDNTLLVFLSDNGACAEELPRTVEAGRWRRGATRDGRPVRIGDNPEIMPGPEDTYQFCGVPWANVSNTPFRMYKHWTYRGGIATPCIVHWPTGIEERGGMRTQYAYLPDWMATVLDVSGAEYPASFHGNAIPKHEGVSLLPAFENQSLPDRLMFWEHEGNAAVRDGDWKLVLNFCANSSGRDPQRPERGDWELYNTADDPTEMRNMASDHPDRVQRMKAAWHQWADRVGVIPREEWLRCYRQTRSDHD